MGILKCCKVQLMVYFLSLYTLVFLKFTLDSCASIVAEASETAMVFVCAWTGCPNESKREKTPTSTRLVILFLIIKKDPRASRN